MPLGASPSHPGLANRANEVWDFRALDVAFSVLHLLGMNDAAASVLFENFAKHR
jgi:hypothetical protein